MLLICIFKEKIILENYFFFKILTFFNRQKNNKWSCIPRIVEKFHYIFKNVKFIF